MVCAGVVCAYAGQSHVDNRSHLAMYQVSFDSQLTRMCAYACQSHSLARALPAVAQAWRLIFFLVLFFCCSMRDSFSRTRCTGKASTSTKLAPFTRAPGIKVLP